MIQRKQIGESIRRLGLSGEETKKGTPTMGGLIILSAIIIPTLLFARLDNIYIQIMLVSTIWLGTIGFIDDYIKVFKKDKEGLAGRFKVLGQIGIAIIVGLVMVFHPDIVVKHEASVLSDTEFVDLDFTAQKSSKPLLHSLKNNEFDYHSLTSWMGDKSEQYSWIIFV